MKDEDLIEKINELEEEFKSFKMGLTVIIVASVLFIIVFQAFTAYFFISGLPINELRYYNDRAIEFFQRVDDINGANKFLWWLNQWPELPYDYVVNPIITSNVNESLISVVGEVS